MRVANRGREHDMDRLARHDNDTDMKQMRVYSACLSSRRRSRTSSIESFPPGRWKRITLDLIAACIVFGKAAFTFNFVTGTADDETRTVDNTKYGTFDRDLYPPALFEDVKAWLLDEEAVPTEWDVLERIREQHNAA